MYLTFLFHSLFQWRFPLLLQRMPNQALESRSQARLSKALDTEVLEEGHFGRIKALIEYYRRLWTVRKGVANHYGIHCCGVVAK